MFSNRQQLAEMIEKVMTERNLSLMDSIVHISEKYQIEIETIALQIRQSHKLKDMLRQEAIQLKMVRE